MTRHWTCRKCGGYWPRARTLCRTPGCKGRKPKRRPPAHREILAVPYERWVEVFGEVCGVCGAKPKPGKKLNRDHAHRKPYGARGLLCQKCNRWLPYFATVDWLLNAAKYLDRPPIERL
jgi:hypothetical protein